MSQKAAAQCGYCTPGMIMSAKALLDETPHPTRAQIEAGISGNLCRCTGYEQIIQAIQLAAGETPPAPAESKEPGALGRSVERVDIRTKVAGTRKYPGDFDMPGQLYGAVAWSAHPHAIVKRLDVSRAAAHPGVVRVLTHADVPVNEYGINAPDQPVLVAPGGKVRWLGDRLAVVVAETEEAARQAAALVEAEYEPLPVVSDPRKAMEPGAPLVQEKRESNVLHHVKIRRGDVDAAFAQAAVVVEGEYYTPFVEHAYMQPEAGLGYIDEQGRVTVIAAAQWPHDDLHQISHMLALPEEQLREIVPAIGGAFGGREDMFIQHLLALCAHVVRRPVKMVFTREESITRTGKRHPFYFKQRWAADADGRLLAVDIEGIADSGAYQSTSIPVLNNAVSFFAGPYKVPAARVDGYAVFTNNAVTMAMRGFGATQPPFAYEQQMDLLAEKLGMDPVEIRMRNLLEEGDMALTGNAMPAGVGLKATLRAAALAAGWKEEARGWARPPRAAASGPAKRRGVGVACALQERRLQLRLRRQEHLPGHAAPGRQGRRHRGHAQDGGHRRGHGRPHGPAADRRPDPGHPLRERALRPGGHHAGARRRQLLGLAPHLDQRQRGDPGLRRRPGEAPGDAALRQAGAPGHRRVHLPRPQPPGDHRL